MMMANWVMPLPTSDIAWPKAMIVKASMPEGLL
jgi:hypothetical protein